MAQKSFTAQVDEWVRETKARMEAVFKESTQRTADMMRVPVAKSGAMPVVTGFLRNSLQGGVNAPAPMPSTTAPRSDSAAEAGITLAIASAEIGDTVYMTFGANYARYVEYGTRGRSGRGFVRLAVQKWQSTVSDVALEARRRASQR